MTLKEQKIAIEESVKKVVSENLKEEVNVKASYDLENGVMNVSILEEGKENETKTILNYEMSYIEDKAEMIITAFKRYIQFDMFGPASVINVPVSVDETFLVGIKNIIAYGIDVVMHPERYETASVESEDPDRAAE